MQIIILTLILCSIAFLIHFSVRHTWWRKNLDLTYPRILMYHMISPHLPKKYSKFNRLRVTPEMFEKQLHWLVKNAWHSVTTSELAQMKNIPPKTVALTFDDGYADNYIHAFKLLKQYNVKATIYLVTERFNQDWATDKDTKLSSNELNQEVMLTHEMVLEMLESGLIEIGSHTLHHANLPALSPQDQENEIRLAKEILEQTYHIKCESFAYPFGFFNQTTSNIVEKAGYTNAVTTVPLCIPWTTINHYEIPRIIISGRQNLLDFKLKLLKGRNR